MRYQTCQAGFRSAQWTVVPGASYGAEQAVLTAAQMPPHTHAVPGLDFDRWVSAFGLSGADAAFDADPDGDGVKNSFEWALGRNPTNGQSSAGLSITSGIDTVSFNFRGTRMRAM